MRLASRIVITIIIATVVILACLKAKSIWATIFKTEKVIATIPPCVKSETVVESNAVTVKTSESSKKEGGKTVVKETKKYVNEDAKVTHTVSQDGIVEVIVKELGLCFTPELVAAIDLNHFRGGVGIKWCYWNRFSSSIGVQMYDLNLKNVNPYVSIDYTLPYLKNTRVGVYYGFNEHNRHNVGLKLSISL